MCEVILICNFVSKNQKVKDWFRTFYLSRKSFKHVETHNLKLCIKCIISKNCSIKKHHQSSQYDTSALTCYSRVYSKKMWISVMLKQFCWNNVVEQST